MTRFTHLRMLLMDEIHATHHFETVVETIIFVGIYVGESIPWVSCSAGFRPQYHWTSGRDFGNGTSPGPGVGGGEP